MITEEKLLKLDFDNVYEEEDSYIKGQYIIHLTDGVVDFIRESGNYQGLTVELIDTKQLMAFFKYLQMQ